MSDLERRKIFSLRAKGYPIRITTRGGKFFFYLGLSVHMRSTLEQTVSDAIRLIEARTAPPYHRCPYAQ